MTEATDRQDASSRFACVLTAANEPACKQIALVTITDKEGGRARGCPRHAMLALEGITGAAVDWADSKGLNEFHVKALELTEEIASRPPLQQAQACTCPPGLCSRRDGSPEADPSGCAVCAGLDDRPCPGALRRGLRARVAQ